MEMMVYTIHAWPPYRGVLISEEKHVTWGILPTLQASFDYSHNVLILWGLYGNVYGNWCWSIACNPNLEGLIWTWTHRTSKCSLPSNWLVQTNWAKRLGYMRVLYIFQSQIINLRGWNAYVDSLYLDPNDVFAATLTSSRHLLWYPIWLSHLTRGHGNMSV